MGKDRTLLAGPIAAAAPLVGLAAASVVAPTSPTRAFVGLGALVVCAAVMALAAPPARAVAAMVAALLAAVATGLPWQAAMLVALASFFAVARRWPALAPASAWRERGRVPLAATAFVGGVTPFALGAWFIVARPDVTDLVAQLPHVSRLALIAGGVAFALVNATLEELIWRGVLTDRLEVATSAQVALVLQAVSFGVGHYHGFPRGSVGALLAGTWALMLGWLRRRSGGLLAPILAHVVADAAIAVIVLGFAAR